MVARDFACTFQEARRRVRSWPFDTLIGAFCTTFRALSDAPISVANGHDLDPLRAWSQIALPLIGLLGTGAKMATGTPLR